MNSVLAAGSQCVTQSASLSHFLQTVCYCRDSCDLTDTGQVENYHCQFTYQVLEGDMNNVLPFLLPTNMSPSLFNVGVVRLCTGTGYFQWLGILLLWKEVGQKPYVLAVGGGCFDIFFSSLSNLFALQI